MFPQRKCASLQIKDMCLLVISNHSRSWKTEYTQRERYNKTTDIPLLYNQGILYTTYMITYNITSQFSVSAYSLYQGFSTATHPGTPNIKSDIFPETLSLRILTYINIRKWVSVRKNRLCLVYCVKVNNNRRCVCNSSRCSRQKAHRRLFKNN